MGSLSALSGNVLDIHEDIHFEQNTQFYILHFFIQQQPSNSHT